MKKIFREYRKATESEINTGSNEMILVSEYEMDVQTPDRDVALWRIKAILQIRGMSQQIESALNQLEEPTKTIALISWNNGNVIKQNSQTVQFIQSVIGLTDEQVNDIFDAAESIEI